ncbi:tRNA (adenosine(37)-N6)-dimethylallyltransferase MiaA [Sinanaerobacter chloroacetimidivorans]|jgi:tRNA dimethylallyltransferase|uniref:tRNA dimethylallyltransferase n=1 Tax=Sinanaerobacter chloroacetimidivorans TaxID=2818044 RepID=A0A8J7VZS8_9FIRM|nr:tRNA (adenosine(37)-N6)-dimethylallyltransferase MiaA [Sinanaerobacter chloroacetimidivorans]MBR0596613.1 tRNA (adenosine(37)-N6)-dimethylallyltransferase MiaA [Sinanaerobacter chloroacetimidivorans]
MNQKIVIIAGPTAVGKTKYAIEIAKHFHGEIVSADSMQIYKYMDIGSAKPTPEELAEVHHYLVDQIDPRNEFSVAEYQTMAKDCICNIFRNHKLPIISGGTGLYLNSLIYDMNFSVMPKQTDIRERLEEEAREHGNEYVHDRLKVLDPDAAERIHPNNLKKVIRALEVLETSGEGIREFKESFVKTKDYGYILIGLLRDREELYGRIDQRVDLLVEKGLIKEVEQLLDKGLKADHISMKGIGYKEIIGYLNGEYDRDEAIRLVKRNTRHYAKRQLTWLRRYSDMKWFNLSDYETENDALGFILKYCKTELNL